MKNDRLHGYLMDWSQDVLQEVEGVFPSSSPLWKIMMGTGGISFNSFYVHDNWKYWQLGALNTLIMAMPVCDRNVIVAKYVLGLKGNRFRQKIGTSKSSSYRILSQIHSDLRRNLDNILGKTYPKGSKINRSP